MSIVVKQNQINIGNLGNIPQNNEAARYLLQTVVDLFSQVDGWSVVEDVNTFVGDDSSYPIQWTAMLNNSNSGEYMRLWFGFYYLSTQFFTLVDSDSVSTKKDRYLHKNNVFRFYKPSSNVKYYSYQQRHLLCGISDETISKELGYDLGLKLPLFELFSDVSYSSSSTYKYMCSMNDAQEGGSSQTALECTCYGENFSNKEVKLSLVGDTEDSEFVFILNNSYYPSKLKWSVYAKDLISPANQEDEYVQASVFDNLYTNDLKAVFRAVDGSISFGQYNTVLDGVTLPAGAASDEGIVASPLFLSSQLESAGLDVPNVDNGSGYKGQIKTDWLLVSNSQVAGTTHNQGTWLNVGGGILVPWLPDAGSPFIS